MSKPLTQEQKDQLKAEYELIQEKKSELSAKQRKLVVDLYEYIYKIERVK